MARFQAPKGYHFSEDGTDKTTWAHFTKVSGSNPAVYEFETTKPSDVAKLRKLIESDDYGDITEVETKPKRGKSTPADTGQAGGEADGGAAANGDADGEGQSAS